MYALLPTGERASTLAEVQMIIDQAKANTELLSDMLLNRQQPGGGGGAGSPCGTDEFEHGLQVELITEVRERGGDVAACMHGLSLVTVGCMSFFAEALKSPSHA